MGAVEDLVLPPIRALIGRSTGLTVHSDPYSGPFEAYHFFATGAQAWDVAATLAVAAGRPGPVLDLGCGRGRLALALAAAGHDVTAVDTAAGSLRHLRAAAAADGGTRLTIVEGDALGSGTLPAGGFGVVVLGDLSINMFADEAALARLGAAVDRLLAPGGVWSLPVLAPDSVAGYARMHGMTAVPYPDDHGVEQLMWLVLRFEPAGPHFLRTLFVQGTPDQAGRLRGHVTAVRERLWTRESVAPVLDAAGFVVGAGRPVNNGTAEVLTVSRRADRVDP